MKNTLTHEIFSVALSLCRVVRRLIGPVLSLLLVLNFSPAYAWGSKGHQVIARLALAQLTPKVRIEVDRLLAQHANLLDPNLLRAVQHAAAARTFITDWANIQVEQVNSSFQKKVESFDWPSPQPFQSHHDLAPCHACR